LRLAARSTGAGWVRGNAPAAPIQDRGITHQPGCGAPMRVAVAAAWAMQTGNLLRGGKLNIHPLTAPRRVALAALGMALASLFAAARAARACDLCAIYTATELQAGRTGFRLAVAEQFTHFGTLRDEGEKVDNPGERIDSSITQLIAGYNFHERFGLQIALPIITRHYRRLEGDRLASGDETGIGDLTLIGEVTPYRYVGTDSVVHISALGGLKLPSGDSSRLREELEEDSHDGGGGLQALPEGTAGVGVRAHSGHAESASGVHGHDLTLGSGSVDGIVGGSIYASWRRLFLHSAIQYAIRREGSFRYEYANDLLWEIGPGVYALLDDTLWGDGVTLAVSAVFSGESKSNDRLRGEKLTDTGITALYLGPFIDFTWGSALHASVGADLPVLQNNSSLQILPDYRIRGGITWRF
jgi:hypothetical protein